MCEPIFTKMYFLFLLWYRASPCLIFFLIMLPGLHNHFTLQDLDTQFWINPGKYHVAILYRQVESEEVGHLRPHSEKITFTGKKSGCQSDQRDQNMVLYFLLNVKRYQSTLLSALFPHFWAAVFSYCAIYCRKWIWPSSCHLGLFSHWLKSIFPGSVCVQW